MENLHCRHLSGRCCSEWSRGRGKAAAKDDFSKYQPWENPNYYAGVMRFRCGNRNFRLERSFDRISKQVSLVCEDDGEELSVEHGDLDMLLGGITPGMYDNTVSIGQFQEQTRDRNWRKV